MENQKWVDEKLAVMTAPEKVAQLLMVAFFELPYKREDIEDKILKYKLGGIFQPATSKETLAGILEEIQSKAQIPLLIGCDYEGGSGWTIEGGLRFPRAMARGFAGDVNKEYEIGKAIARQGRAIGSIVTFSPVVDLNTHPQNPDVNVRAYGEDTETVIKLAVPYIKGLQDNGMLACVKHFPGNGGTAMDQHICPAIMPQSAEEFRETCLKTYKNCFEEADPAMVMVAHLEVPALVKEINPKNGRPVPASLSYEIITGLLKGELGFKGVVITDALNMGGVTSQYTREEAAVKTIKAGADMLLVFNPDFEREYDAILRAVMSGEISSERLDDAVRNILNSKVRAGLLKDKGIPAPPSEIEELFKPGKYDGLCEEIIKKGITVLRNINDVLPIKDIKDKKVAVLSTFSPDEDTFLLQGQEILVMKDRTADFLRERGACVEHFILKDYMDNRRLHKIIDKLRDENYEYIFFNFFIVPSWGIGTLIPNKSALRMFMFGLLSMGRKVVITSFGDPYVMYYCPTAEVYMCTYDETENAQKAAVNAWLGEAPVSGRSPVSLDGIFKRGDGIILGE